MTTSTNYAKLSVGTKSLILSKLYYSVLSKSLEELDVERYYSVLFFLNENNGCNQQCICNNLAIDKTAMVKVIDYLIKVGFVDRNVNPDDRREHFIVLTKKGLKQTAEIVKAFEDIDREIFSSIPKEEQVIFNKVMCQLSSKLKELPANDLFFNYKQTARKKKSIASDKI
jgi:DNA-binding MarR family transcriptional regulator